jgi:hypothetical protein
MEQVLYPAEPANRLNVLCMGLAKYVMHVLEKSAIERMPCLLPIGHIGNVLLASETTRTGFTKEAHS